MTKRIAEFDIWRPGYGDSLVSIYVAGTSTLADVFTDEALSIVADNPQTLSAMASHDGTRYGKFTFPIYTEQSYFLSIDGIEDTGIVRPAFSSLSGEDVSKAVITALGSTYAIDLDKVIAQEVNVANYGALVEGAGGVSATNTATIDLAIAALSDGGFVNIPAGLYKVNSFDIPQGVIIRGQGRDATVLESILGDDSFTLVGDRSGFQDITLDGNSLSTDSVGIKSVGHNETILNNVVVKRFETGVYFEGGKGHIWNDFSINNVVNGAKLFGETTAFEDLIWTGGLVSVATTYGIYMSYEDKVCHNINFIGVGFESNVGQAIKINGAQYIQFMGCWGVANTDFINIQDDTDILTPATQQENDSISIRFIGGRINGGIFEATGTAQDILLKGVKIKDVEFKMTTPLNNFVILEDCFEESGVTITGEPAKLLRRTTLNNGSSFGVTTAATATKTWSIPLQAGQVVYLEAKVLAKGRNGADRAVYHIGCGAYRAGSDLDYDTQTANFTEGATITGASSGAKARIQVDVDGGTTGTLTLIDIRGTFIDNEIIEDDNGTPGSATVNGVITEANASLDTTGNVNIRTVYETSAGFLAAFVANGQEIELQVTGAASKTIEWTVHVDVEST